MKIKYISRLLVESDLLKEHPKSSFYLQQNMLIHSSWSCCGVPCTGLLIAIVSFGQMTRFYVRYGASSFRQHYSVLSPPSSPHPAHIISSQSPSLISVSIYHSLGLSLQTL